MTPSPTIHKFDIFPAKTAFEREQLKRARRLSVVLAKLRWFRMGGEASERQWSDIRGVAEIQAGQLDMEYLNRWARELGVADLLAAALR